MYPNPATATGANASAASVDKPPAISIANTQVAAVDQAAAAASNPERSGCCRTWLPSEAIAAVLDAKPVQLLLGEHLGGETVQAGAGVQQQGQRCAARGAEQGFDDHPGRSAAHAERQQQPDHL